MKGVPVEQPNPDFNQSDVSWITIIVGWIVIITLAGVSCWILDVFSKLFQG